VLKLYSELLRWELPKEAYVYELVAGLGLPMATILHADDSRTVLPRGFAVMTKLDGELLMDVQPGLGDAELTSIYRQVGALLRRLHAVRLDAFGYVDTDRIVDPQPTNDDYMRSQFEKRLARFVELGGDAGLRARIASHVAEREEQFSGCETAVLCHNDCHEANLLVTREDGEWRISGVVDFGNATAADPLLDLAKTSCYSRSEGRLDALAEGHGELRTDWREAVRLYELYHRLELWWWFASNGIHLDVLPRLEASLARTVGV
jgi:aminoglycoside phosphotransferase (APT) family kinase protein